MEAKEKAIELYKKHKFKIANIVVDSFLDECQKNFNQAIVDFWLDVKLELKNLQIQF